MPPVRLFGPITFSANWFWEDHKTKVVFVFAIFNTIDVNLNNSGCFSENRVGWSFPRLHKQMQTTKNIEGQVDSVGDPISSARNLELGESVKMTDFG